MTKEQIVQQQKNLWSNARKIRLELDKLQEEKNTILSRIEDLESTLERFAIEDLNLWRKRDPNFPG